MIFSSLNEKELAQFLIFDYFDSIHQIKWIKDINEESFLKGLELHIKKYKKKKLFLSVLDKFFFRLLKWQKFHGKTILFEESKFFPIPKFAKKKYKIGMIVEGQKDRLFAFSNFIGYITTNDLDFLLYSFLKDKNINHLRQLVEKCEEKLKIIKPDYIVFTHDVFPVQRAMILAAKKLGIVTLAVQRAIYDLPTPMIDFKAADYILVWGKYFKRFCIEYQKVSPENIFILGYPKKITKFKNINKKCKVCYLGQDIERHDGNLLQQKIKTIEDISIICQKLKLSFVYRPHYAESSLQNFLPQIRFTAPKESLEQTFDNADIFISFSSTSLVEASMQGKITIQLLNYPIETDNFENLGACTKTVKNITELEEYLSQDLNKIKPDFNNDYVETNYNPGERFIEIISAIEKKNEF